MCWLYPECCVFPLQASFAQAVRHDLLKVPLRALFIMLDHQLRIECTEAEVSSLQCFVDAGWCPGPTILVNCLIVYLFIGRHWYNWDGAQLADWIRGHLHQCKPVYLSVLFLLFTGCVGPASFRLLLYWAWCCLVFGWQAATWSLSSAKWQLPSTECIVYVFV